MSAHDSQSDRLLIGVPGPVTGGLLDRLEARRALRLKQEPSPHLWVLVSILGDLIMVVTAEHLAYWLRFQSFMRDYGNWMNVELRQYAGHMALGALSLLLALGWQGIYHRSTLLRSRWIAARIARAVLIWTLGFLSFTLALKLQPSISRVYVALNGACALLLLLSWRWFFRQFSAFEGEN